MTSFSYSLNSVLRSRSQNNEKMWRQRRKKHWFKKYVIFKRNLFFSQISLKFFFQNWWQTPGSGSKLGQNSESESKFNVFGSTTLVVNVIQITGICQTWYWWCCSRHWPGWASRRACLSCPRWRSPPWESPTPAQNASPGSSDTPSALSSTRTARPVKERSQRSI